MLVPSLALLVGCREEPYTLTLSLQVPGDLEERLAGAHLELVATDAEGARTVLPLGPAESGAPVERVLAVPSSTVSVGLLAEDNGGTDGEIDLDRAFAWGEAPFSGGTSPGSSSEATFLMAPLGEVLGLDGVAPNRRVVGGATAVDSAGQVFVFGGETPGTTSQDRSSPKIFRIRPDLGETALEPVEATLPVTIGLEPEGLNEVPLEYRGRVLLTATTVQTRDGERILVAGGQPSLDYSFAPSSQALLYDPATDTLDALEMPTSRTGHLALRHPNGNVLFYGGFVDNAIPRPSYFVWDAQRGFQQKSSILSTGATGVTGTILEDDAVVCGGDLLQLNEATEDQVWTPQAGCERLRPNGEARDFDRLPEPLSYAAMATLADGSLLIAGGYSEPAIDIVTDGLVDEFGRSAAVNGSWRWTKTDGWKPVGGLEQARAGHAMVALADGSAIVIGGDSFGSPFLGDLVDPVRCPERFDPVTDTWQLLACEDATAGTRPTVAVQPGGGDVLILAGYTFQEDGEVGGGTALGVMSTGPFGE
jgi:hypothetical protein